MQIVGAWGAHSRAGGEGWAMGGHPDVGHCNPRARGLQWGSLCHARGGPSPPLTHLLLLVAPGGLVPLPLQLGRGLGQALLQPRQRPRQRRLLLLLQRQRLHGDTLRRGWGTPGTWGTLGTRGGGRPRHPPAASRSRHAAAPRRAASAPPPARPPAPPAPAPSGPAPHPAPAAPQKRHRSPKISTEPKSASARNLANSRSSPQNGIASEILFQILYRPPKSALLSKFSIALPQICITTPKISMAPPSHKSASPWSPPVPTFSPRSRSSSSSRATWVPRRFTASCSATASRCRTVPSSSAGAKIGRVGGGNEGSKPPKLI